MSILSQEIRKRILGCPKKYAIFQKLNPILFDVSLRDGIQGANPSIYMTGMKKHIFHRIISQETPKKMEIGSIVSPKILPIMNDTLDLYRYSQDPSPLIYDEDGQIDIEAKKIEKLDTEIYVLVPTLQKLSIGLSAGIRNFSFLTSVSDKFQMKNVGKDIRATCTEFDDMFRLMGTNGGANRFGKKLYISCIDHCPILGKIDPDFILHEILYYHTKFEFDELCLSDTCGKLDSENFEYILDHCILFGIPPSKLSLHLHVGQDNLEYVEQNIWFSLDKGVRRFDVSAIGSGGCSVTMNVQDLAANLSYDQFWSIIDKYINKKIYNNMSI